MVNTFLIGSFEYTAITLDKRRRFKQCLEAKHIIELLESQNGGVYKKDRYKNHPAVRMWRPYLNALKYYYNTMLNICLEVDKVNTLLQYYEVISYERPWFLDYPPLIYSHRARLYQKDPVYYNNLLTFPQEYLSIGYIWTSRYDKQVYLNANTIDEIKLLADPLSEEYQNPRYCKGILQSGSRKGLYCGLILKDSRDFCGIHSKKIDKNEKTSK